MVRDEVMMNNRMEWSWFRVLIKVEQINDNLFLNTCVVKTNRKLHEWMRWRWVDTKWRWGEKPSRVSYQRYPSRRSPGEYRLWWKGDAKKWDFNFFRKREVERSEIGEWEVGKKEMEWWGEWRRHEGRLFHNTGAEWKNDLLVISRPEVTEGRLSVIVVEERVERWGVREKRAKIRRVTSF